MSATCCGQQMTDEEYAVHLATGLHGKIASLIAERDEAKAEYSGLYKLMLKETGRLTAERDDAEGALQTCARYIRYGDGQGQDLNGKISRSRGVREDVESRPSRGDALKAADAVLGDAG